MSEIIDTTSPITVIGGKRRYSALTPYGNSLVGKIDAWLIEHPGYHPPSKVARGVKISTPEADAILSWLDDREMFVVGGRNGCWRKYGSRG